jgi:hypothetical protein
VRITNSVGIACVLVCVLATLSSSEKAQARNAPVVCDRPCLYKVLDDYLAALKVRDPTMLHWAKQAKYTENNVALRIGDGLWGTLTALDTYQMRFADVEAGQVAIFGVLEETTTKAPYATRLKVVNGAIAEVETIVVRPQDSGIPFVTADIQPLDVFSETLAPNERAPRAQMVAAANGYFDTLQLNDGKLYVEFTDNCNRRENGMRSTNLANPGLDPLWKYGCAEQFRLGQYRYDDRLRDRRFLAVDEERGIVLAGGFIDHEGKLGDFRLTDGTMRTSIFRRPHSFVLLEAFKIKGGKIEQVEAVFITVPYNMPSPWSGGKLRGTK